MKHAMHVLLRVLYIPYRTYRPSSCVGICYCACHAISIDCLNHVMWWLEVGLDWTGWWLGERRTLLLVDERRRR